LTGGKLFHVLYGISQNPDTNDYLLVQNNFTKLINWNSENEKINNFICEMQLKINSYNDKVFEWIPYKQFYEIKEMTKDSSITVYSAIWKDGPLRWNRQNEKYTRDSNKEITLKCLNDSQNLTEFIIDKV
jgi:hypothetical protein